MKKVLLITLISLLLVSTALFTSCKGKGKLDIGIAMPETHVARWVTDGEKLLENATALGYKAEVAYGDADQTKQNKQIQDFITKGVKLIIVASINTGINTVLADAAEAGIKVISYDRLCMDTGDLSYYITFNLEKVGTLQGQAIAEALDLKNASKKQYITLFGGSPTDNNAYFFYKGAHDVLKPFIDAGKLEVVGPYPKTHTDKDTFQKIATPGWRAEEAKKRMENLLTGDAAGYVLDAVLAPNDPVGRAIVDACLTDAKYDSIDKLPVITGQDGELATVQYILEGKQAMTVFKDSRKLAEATVKLADAILKGKTPSIPGTEKTTFDTGVKKVPTYLLDPVNVNKSNVKAEIIDSGYYTADELKTIGQ